MTADVVKPSIHRISRDFSLPIRLCRYSGRRHVWWALLAGAMILARIALLPVLPPPEPVIHDEFSYLLAADTFAHGRLSNPAVPSPEFFEASHVLLSPIYASKYQPGQGLVLGFGQKLLGHPYWGVVLSCAVMVFLFCWAADPWIPPQWTLIVGALSSVLFFIGHYWFSSYWGGALAACGGALVVGGLGRLLRGKVRGANVSLAVGALILYATRPYEGGVLCLATLGILTLRFSSGSREQWKGWLRAVILPNAAVLVAAVPLIAWYNHRITGHVSDLPYLEYSRQQDLVPTFWMLPAYAQKEYSNANVRAAHQTERNDYQQVRGLSLPKAVSLQLIRFAVAGVWVQFLNFGLLLAGLPWARMRGQKKWLITLFLAGVFALMPEVWVYPHYTAPFTAAGLILIVAAGRAMWYRLAAARWRGPIFLMALIVLFTPLGVEYAGAIQAHPTERGRLIRQLEAQGGRHLVFVNYSEGWNSVHEWVYNRADLEDAAVLFAHLRTDEENRQLLERFPGRTAWIVQLGPSLTDVRLEPYERSLARAAP